MYAVFSLSARILTLMLLVLSLLLMACQPPPPPRPADLQIATLVPTLDNHDPALLCDVVAQQWGRDWPLTLQALEALNTLPEFEACQPGFDLQRRLYTAYIALGTLLEQHGRRADAIQAYERALAHNFTGQEAIARLQTLNAFTLEPPPACELEIVNGLFATLPRYEATEGEFVGVQGNRFVLAGAAYPVYGVNYYPRDYPFRRFLTQMDVKSVDFELEILQASGLNTLRIFLRHDDLFMCLGNGAVPIPVNFARLDAFIHAAAARGFRLILVLNHEPDLLAYPLYEAPTHTTQQMAFIASRYRDEPAVMAYDLRDNGDRDYSGETMRYTRAEVLTWGVEAARLLRDRAPNQLITAGWGDDAESTAPFVDFVSFQHWGEVEALRQEIAILSAATTRPIVLAAFGYNTFEMDEFGQRQAIQRVLEAVQQNNLAGWLVWTGFDNPLSVLCAEPECPAQDGPLNRYGLWNTSYFPKRALDAVHLVTGVAAPE